LRQQEHFDLVRQPSAHPSRSEITMTDVLQSSRFGRIELPSDAVLDFPDGLIGLGGSRYALLAQRDGSPFVWLHSLDDTGLAIPLTNPWRYFPCYEVQLADEDADRIAITDLGEASVYVTVRAAATPAGFSANLRAPLLIADRTGHQVINHAPHATLRAPLLARPVELVA